jgi:hypothetical protein
VYDLNVSFNFDVDHQDVSFIGDAVTLSFSLSVFFSHVLCTLDATDEEADDDGDEEEEEKEWKGRIFRGFITS